MLMIIIGHIAIQAFDSDLLSNNSLVFREVVGNGSRIAVNLFLMTGVWFLIDAKFSAARIVKLYSSLWFYSVVITVSMYLLTDQVKTTTLISGFFPFLRRRPWFVALKIALLLISPFLQSFVKSMSKRKLKGIVILGLFLVSFMCTVERFSDTYLCEFTWFVFVYLLIAYYKKFGQSEHNKHIHPAVLLLMGLLIYGVLVGVKVVGIYRTGSYINIAVKISEQILADYKSIPNLLCSFCIFEFFVSLKIKTNRVINGAAKNTLDVYMIHQSPALIYFLWWNILQTKSWQTSSSFAIYYLLSTIIVFIGCSFIGRLRIRFLEPMWVKSGLYRKMVVLVDEYYKKYGWL